jgi:hypothetical protein
MHGFVDAIDLLPKIGKRRGVRARNLNHLGFGGSVPLQSASCIETLISAARRESKENIDTSVLGSI